VVFSNKREGKPRLQHRHTKKMDGTERKKGKSSERKRKPKAPPETLIVLQNTKPMESENRLPQKKPEDQQFAVPAKKRKKTIEIEESHDDPEEETATTVMEIIVKEEKEEDEPLPIPHPDKKEEVEGVSEEENKIVEEKVNGVDRKQPVTVQKTLPMYPLFAPVKLPAAAFMAYVPSQSIKKGGGTLYLTWKEDTKANEKFDVAAAEDSIRSDMDIAVMTFPAVNQKEKTAVGPILKIDLRSWTFNVLETVGIFQPMDRTLPMNSLHSNGHLHHENTTPPSQFFCLSLESYVAPGYGVVIFPAEMTDDATKKGKFFVESHLSRRKYTPIKVQDKTFSRSIRNLEDMISKEGVLSRTNGTAVYRCTL